MIVGMWMTRDLVTIQPGTPVAQAASLMAKHKIRRLPVTEVLADGTHLLGLVSSTDIYRAYPHDKNPFATDTSDALEPKLTIDQIMSRELLTTTSQTPIEEAASVMRDRKIGALPVLHDALLVGLITESDIFRAFIGMLTGEAGSTRITFSTPARDDAFEWLAAETRTRRVHVQSVFLSLHGEQTVCVARMTGPDIDRAVEDLWRSGHQVLNILRWPDRRQRSAPAPRLPETSA